MAQKEKFEGRSKEEERIVRILSTDIEGYEGIYPGLTKIKGISWSLSNAICKSLGFSKNRKIGSLTEEEVKKISVFVKNPSLPSFLFNRRNDFDSGENRHLVSSDLDLRKDFDIKRLKKIRSYRGIRHAAKLPVRGQRTKGHFRKNIILRGTRNEGNKKREGKKVNKKTFHKMDSRLRGNDRSYCLALLDFLSLIAAWAAARRAMGIRYGEQLT